MKLFSAVAKREWQIFAGEKVRKTTWVKILAIVYPPADEKLSGVKTENFSFAACALAFVGYGNDVAWYVSRSIAEFIRIENFASQRSSLTKNSICLRRNFSLFLQTSSGFVLLVHIVLSFLVHDVGKKFVACGLAAVTPMHEAKPKVSCFLLLSCFGDLSDAGQLIAITVRIIVEPHKVDCLPSPRPLSGWTENQKISLLRK